MGLRASGEDYLEAILVLQKQKGVVRSVDVARHLEVSKPSVSHAVTTLKEGGFLTMDEDFFLHLTDLGREVAEQTYEKHRFFTDLLTKAGVDPASAERDACRMEHVISQIWQKYTLSIEEASRYFRIGEKKLRRLAEENPDANSLIMNGNLLQIKRRQFEKVIDELEVI